MSDRGRKLQLLTDRAGRRWSRRLSARMAAWRTEPDRVEAMRVLENEAEALFLRIKAEAPVDPFAALIAAESAIEPRNPDDPDDEL